MEMCTCLLVYFCVCVLVYVPFLSWVYYNMEEVNNNNISSDSDSDADSDDMVTHELDYSKFCIY